MNPPAALQRRLEYAGPAIFSYGFRPFFLGGAAWAALSVALWLPQYFGELSLPTAFNPVDWHIHEMIYGYVAATVTGFLLTAIPNWTGRLPVNGYPLAGLFALWLAGRVAVAGSAIWGQWIAAAIDVAFLVIFAAIALREIIAGNNWRNLRVLVMLGVLIAGNIVFHAEEILHGSADYGVRIGIAALIGLIMLVGGRIVPSFTNNWLTRNNPGRLPIAFSRYDAVTLGSLKHARDHQHDAAGGGLGQRNPRRKRQRYPSPALGRRSHFRRSSRSGPSRCLCLRAAWLHALGRSNSMARLLADQCRRSRLDHRCSWPDDTRSDDTRESWPHWTAARRVPADAVHLLVRSGRSACAHHRGVRAVKRPTLRRRASLVPGVRRFYRIFRPAADGAATGVVRSGLNNTREKQLTPAFAAIVQ